MRRFVHYPLAGLSGYLHTIPPRYGIDAEQWFQADGRRSSSAVEEYWDAMKEKLTNG